MLEKLVIEIAPRTWLISEYKLVNMYLLEGDTQALLIDCGAGVGNVAQTVRRLTQKPLTVVVTHGHYDHDGGAMLFEAVYMHPLDIPFSKEMCENGGEEARREYAKSRGTVRNPGADVEEIAAMVQPNSPVTRLPLEEGHVFDLGGRHIEVIHTPGHSVGSVCFLDREQRLLYTGDMANDSLLLNLGDSCATVEEYRDSIDKLWSREKEYDALCPGHDALEKEDKTILQDYRQAAQMLLEGKAQGKPGGNALHGGIGYQYKRVLLWYDPEKLSK